MHADDTPVPVLASRAVIRTNCSKLPLRSRFGNLTRELQARIGRARDQLLVFLDHPGTVEVTNNGCERLLRPAVVQRKMTNGCRAMWSATGEADIRTVVDTARLSGANPFATILATVA